MDDSRRRRVPIRPGPTRPRPGRLLPQFCRPEADRPVNFRPVRVPRPPHQDDIEPPEECV